MRRVLLALAFLLGVVSSAGAQGPPLGNTRLAVFLMAQTSGGGTSLGTLEGAYIPDFMLFDQLGISYDVYNADVRTWGSSGVADSVWFRQRYGAVWIPFLQDNNNRGVNSYALRFLNASSVAGWDKSPITGKWSIPVYIKNSLFGFKQECMTPLTSDSLRTGLLENTRSIPTQPESVGTWRDRSLVRHSSGRIDTLYNRPGEIGQRSPTGMLGQFTAAISWMDTTHAAVASDTLYTTWRYKPFLVTDPAKPGAVFTLLNTSQSTGTGVCGGALVLLQTMLNESTVKAARKIPLAYTIHHAQSGRTPDANTEAMVNGMLSAHERAGIYSYFAMKVAPSEWAAGGGGGAGVSRTSWDRINRHLNDGWAVWYPHSHATDYDGDETDSTVFRGFYNAMMNTATRPDSFNLPIRRYSPLRMVPANDIMTKAAQATLIRAGMQVAEVVLSGNATGADRLSKPVFAQALSFQTPGLDTRAFAKSTFDLSLQGDFATYQGAVSMSQRINITTAAAIELAIMTGGGIFQHYDALWGNTAGTPYTDRFNEWIVEYVVGGYPRTFDKVVVWERPGTDPRIIAPMRTSR